MGWWLAASGQTPKRDRRYSCMASVHLSVCSVNTMRVLVRARASGVVSARGGGRFRARRRVARGRLRRHSDRVCDGGRRGEDVERSAPETAVCRSKPFWSPRSLARIYRRCERQGPGRQGGRHVRIFVWGARVWARLGRVDQAATGCRLVGPRAARLVSVRPTITKTAQLNAIMKAQMTNANFVSQV